MQPWERPRDEKGHWLATPKSAFSAEQAERLAELTGAQMTDAELDARIRLIARQVIADMTSERIEARNAERKAERQRVAARPWHKRWFGLR